MEKSKCVVIENFEFEHRDLSIIIAFWRSRTIRIPEQGRELVVLKSSCPPETESFRLSS